MTPPAPHPRAPAWRHQSDTLVRFSGLLRRRRRPQGAQRALCCHRTHACTPTPHLLTATDTLLESSSVGVCVCKTAGPVAGSRLKTVVLVSSRGRTDQPRFHCSRRHGARGRAAGRAVRTLWPAGAGAGLLPEAASRTCWAPGHGHKAGAAAEASAIPSIPGGWHPALPRGPCGVTAFPVLWSGSRGTRPERERETGAAGP